MSSYKLKPTKKSIAQLVSAGKYDWSNSDITGENFPLENCAAEVELLTIDKIMTTSEVETKIAADGYEPANMTTLLHFGIQYPEIQRNDWVVALGSVWTCPHRHRGCGYLSGGSARRLLRLVWVGMLILGLIRGELKSTAKDPRWKP